MRPPLPIACTILLGIAVAAAGVYRLFDVSLTTAALFVAAAIVTELVEESDRERSREPVEPERFRVASVVHVAAILLLGPWVGGLVAAAGVVASAAYRTRPLVVALFRASSYALAAAAGGLAFRLARGDIGDVKLLEDLIPIVALGIGYMTVRAILLDVVYARENFDPRIGPGAGEVAFGAIVAILALRHPWDVVAAVPLAYALHTAQARLTRLQRETFRALETFANIVDERDPSTYRHSVRVAAYVDQLARALRLPFSDIDRLRWAARLHDLGKVAVDSTILRKPGRLEREEWAAVRRHPRLSARLLQRFAFVATQARAVELHHERVDGRGYYGVREEDLPLAAHFLIVADSFDAMTTDRPYRPGMTKDDALAEIERNLGTQFHPGVGKAFVAVQRGIDPTTVLTQPELAELQGAHATQFVRIVPGGRTLRERPELLALGGVVLGLVGLAFDQRAIAIAGGVIAAAAAVLHAVARTRAERLAEGLRSALHAAGRESLFEGIVEQLSRAWPVDWAVLVAWDEDGLGGTVAHSRGDAPDANTLLSWLVREAESGADIKVASTNELASGGVTVALPLRRETSQLIGFLVADGKRFPPRPVELALLDTLDELGLAFADRPASPVGNDVGHRAESLVRGESAGVTPSGGRSYRSKV